MGGTENALLSPADNYSAEILSRFNFCNPNDRSCVFFNRSMRVVIKETHNKQAASRKYNKSSSDRTLENISMRLVAFERVHLVNFAVFP